MRNHPIVCVLAVMAVSSAAGAERAVHLEMGGGAPAYQGGLAAYAGEGPRMRLELGVGFRRDQWTVALVGGGIAMEPVDSCASGCGPDGHEGSYYYYGLDLRRAYPLGRAEGPGLGFHLVLQAGPRFFVGDHALTGFMGPGFTAGARIEVDAWALGAFMGVGVDMLAMSMPVDRVVGATPHLSWGIKMGWM